MGHYSDKYIHLKTTSFGLCIYPKGIPKQMTFHGASVMKTENPFRRTSVFVW